MEDWPQWDIPKIRRHLDGFVVVDVRLNKRKSTAMGGGVDDAGCVMDRALKGVKVVLLVDDGGDEPTMLLALLSRD